MIDGIAADKRHSRLQTQDRNRIATFRGQLQELALSKGIADGGVLRIHQGRFAGDLDPYIRALDLQGKIQSCRTAHQDCHILPIDWGESARRNLDAVGRGRKLHELIDAILSRGHGTGEPCLRVTQRNRRTLNQRTFRISNHAVQRGRRLRARKGSPKAKQKTEAGQSKAREHAYSLKGQDFRLAGAGTAGERIAFPDSFPRIHDPKDEDYCPAQFSASSSGNL